MTIRLLILLVVLAAATAIGLLMRVRAGRAREITGGEVLTSADLAAPLGPEATFVQFSSPACSPCRAVRRVLDAVVAADGRLGHVEIDASERLDLARRLDIMRTPTVLVLDGRGVVVRRISGVMTESQAREALPELAKSTKSTSPTRR